MESLQHPKALFEAQTALQADDPRSVFFPLCLWYSFGVVRPVDCQSVMVNMKR